MASEDSDDIPMLRAAAGSSSVELSSSLPPKKQRRIGRYPNNGPFPDYFSGPLQKQNNNTSRKTLRKSSSITYEDGSYNSRSYSGPIVIKNETSITMPSTPPPPPSPLRRRNHRNDNTNSNEHLLRSGPLGKCDDPFCTTCPLYTGKQNRPEYEFQQSYSSNQVNANFSAKIKKLLSDACNFGSAFIPGVMNPHTKIVHKWNKCFLLSCLLAVFVDPLFFFILSVAGESRCIYFNLPFAKVITVLRSSTDLFYFVHILFQFRLAYIGPSEGIASGALIDDPKEIAKHYLCGWFLLDLIVVLPLPQIMIWLVIPKTVGRTDAANFTKNLLRAVILIQYIPRMIRFVPLLVGNSSTGFIFETARANFFINFLLFLLVAHVAGACWYLLGLQRVNQCLRDACREDAICNLSYLDCGEGGNTTDIMSNKYGYNWSSWANNRSGDCLPRDANFQKNSNYGIYMSGVEVACESNIITKYIYSLFWGFQQISTLAGNQMPSPFIGEVLFILGIVVLSLLLLVLLISNMQNFLLSLSRRRVDMQLRRHDVESWMSRRQLPPDSRRKVKEAESFRWAVTRGVNEEQLLRSLPEDIEKEIRKALCLDLIKKVRLFTFMEQQVLDAVCERLRQSLFIGGNIILRKNYPIEKMYFFIKGTLDIVKDDGTEEQLQSVFCGEELLIWCLEQHDAKRPGVKRIKHRVVIGSHVKSSRTIKCSGSVEAFSLSVKDLQEVTKMYSHLLRESKVQGAIRYESNYWRNRAAVVIKHAWKNYKMRTAG